MTDLETTHFMWGWVAGMLSAAVLAGLWDGFWLYIEERKK